MSPSPCWASCWHQAVLVLTLPRSHSQRPASLLKVYTVILYHSRPQRGLWPLPEWRCTGGRKRQTLGIDRSLGASSDLALLPRVLKHHCCPAVRAWLRDSWWSMTKVHLTVGPVGGSPKPSCGYFLIYRMHDWNRHTQQLAEFPRGRDSGQQSRSIWLQGLCSLYYDKCHEGKRSNY